MRASATSAAHPSRRLGPVRLLAAAAAGALLVPTVMVGVASAAGIIGSPQPDAVPFTIGAKSDTGSSVVASDGSLVVAYDLDNTTRVCRIARGARKCSSAVVLTPLDAEDDFSVPQVFAPSPDTIVVLQSTCCATNVNGTLLYTSTDGGRTFGAGVRVGELGTDAATLVGGTIVFSAGDDHDGTEVESTPVTPSGTPAPSSVVDGTNAAYDVYLGNVKGGVILGSDLSRTSDYLTTIRYAAAGADPGVGTSYTVVGSFPGEQLVSIKGDAVLTQLTGGSRGLRLRFFNGTTFTAPSLVPGSKGGGPEWFGLDVDPSGLAHVFIVTSRHSYVAFQVTTRNGVTWSAASTIGDAVDEDGFSAALDKAGTGIMFGSDGVPTIFPILAPQQVTVALSKHTIAVGATTVLSGKVVPKAAGRSVILQYEKSGKWYASASKPESAAGKFAFTITGAAAGKTVYRAVVKDVPGHILIGYSAGVTLTVT